MDKICKMCKFFRYKQEINDFVCNNEESEKFGEIVSPDIQSKTCDSFAPFKYGDISLKEALGIVTLVDMEHAGLVNFFRATLDVYPFIVIKFENNSDMIRWGEAQSRLFLELVKMKKEDGDFK